MKRPSNLASRTRSAVDNEPPLEELSGDFVVRAPPHPHPRRHIARRPSQLGALSFAWSSTAPSVQPFLAHAPWRGLSELGARGEFHLKRRAFARRRLHPDPAPVHFHDLFGDGEAEARAALGLGK